MTNFENALDNILDSYKTEGGINLQEKTYFPNRENVISVLKDIQGVIFPGFHQAETVNSANLRYVTGERLNRIMNVLSAETEKALIYSRTDKDTNCKNMANCIVSDFIEAIPQIRKKVILDLKAALSGDPAAKSLEEVILSYPGPEAIMVHRIAHFLHVQKVPIIPRIMSEYIHGKTGIDIHPGAEIGDSFFIDHGTGVVIGETCIIGNNVKLYQGVTLGALSVKKSLSGKKRHPTIEDDVTIYSGATILGGETVIGKGSTIGGNVWLTESVPAFSTTVAKQETILGKRHSSI
ncbi:MAG: serine acetyltransferase [Treponemataceae bacterium]|nr:serine acetyltransferase [Treponemataceae bacterium]